VIAAMLALRCVRCCSRLPTSSRQTTRVSRVLPSLRQLSAPAEKPAAKPEDKELQVSSSRTASDIATSTGGKTQDGVDVKVWGYGALELPEVSKKDANEAFLDVTDVKRAVQPDMKLVHKARDEMGKDRFNYLATNFNPAAQYIVPGSKGNVAPAMVSQAGLAAATMIVLLGAITATVYIKKSWGVGSMKEFGDVLREKGAARKESMEASKSINLVRTISQSADGAVKANVDIIRRPSSNVGASLTDTFKGGVGAGHGK